MYEFSWLIVILTLLFSAFFSGMEIAFISANKLKIELAKKQGQVPARINSYFMKHQGAFITTMLIGNNAALVIYGHFMSYNLEPMMAAIVTTGFVVFLLQTIVSTLLVLITAEFLPKTIFRIDPNRTLNVFYLPTLLVYLIFYLPTQFTLLITNLFLRLFLKGAQADEAHVGFGKVDLDLYLKEATSQVENKEELEHEVQIFQNALEFSDQKVRECMVPRTDIVALEETESIQALQEKFIETGLSKIPIYRDDIDNIIGYTHSFELFRNPSSIKKILLPISLIPEAMPVNEALSLLNKNKRSIAVVLDEFGGTAGIVTMEDIIEEIVGEIVDEHDMEQPFEEQVNEHEYNFSARIEIDHINDHYHLNLPESEEYETLGGLIINETESIPDQGDLIRIERFEFRIKEVSENKIELVNLRITGEE
ncbi:HlyC/CorC family transporter [bacterium SCSIO 12741]|nr:HlyC/CorC family transporter [bacterium SCSIO 12741]